MKYRIAVPVLLLLGMLPSAELYAQAQTATTTFQVKATVQAVCDVTATDLNFGNYTATSGSPLLGTTTVTATCTPQTTYNIGLSKGTTADGTIQQRKMASGVNRLDYQLYTDSTRLSIWGETIGTDTVSGSGQGVGVPHTVHGSAPAGQKAPAGSYTDTIIVTITY